MRNYKVLKIYAIIGLLVLVVWNLLLIIIYPFHLIRKYFTKSKNSGKLMILLLICLSITNISRAQNVSGTYNIKLYNDIDEVLPEVSKSFLISGASYVITYEALFKNTNLTQNECRLISIGSSLLTGLTLSYFERDKHNSLGYNIYGTILASFTLTVIIGEDKKRDAKRKLIEL